MKITKNILMGEESTKLKKIIYGQQMNPNKSNSTISKIRIQLKEKPY